MRVFDGKLREDRGNFFSSHFIGQYRQATLNWLNFYYSMEVILIPAIAWDVRHCNYCSCVTYICMVPMYFVLAAIVLKQIQILQGCYSKGEHE